VIAAPAFSTLRRFISVLSLVFMVSSFYLAECERQYRLGAIDLVRSTTVRQMTAALLEQAHAGEAACADPGQVFSHCACIGSDHVIARGMPARNHDAVGR
jgi:hypothetical protein